MDDLRDEELLALVASRPDAFGVFYRRHESVVLRFFMERLRSPELAADLTGETFAQAMLGAGRFDPSRGAPGAWLLDLADKQLLRAARTGVVDDRARRKLGVAAQPLDDRTLMRVWELRDETGSVVPKPRCSPSVVLGSPVRERFDEALVEAARRRGRGRRRRVRLSLAARVTLALATVIWFTARAVAPDRPPSAVAATRWLPFASPHGLEGFFPSSWYLASSAQTPARGELMTVTTFPTGEPGRKHCDALPVAAIATMGDADALVSLRESPGATSAEAFPARPDRFTAARSPSLERRLHRCLPDGPRVRASSIAFSDAGRRLQALVVLGTAADETLALEILNRVRLDPAIA